MLITFNTIISDEDNSLKQKLNKIILPKNATLVINSSNSENINELLSHQQQLNSDQNNSDKIVIINMENIIKLTISGSENSTLLSASYLLGNESTIKAIIVDGPAVSIDRTELQNQDIIYYSAQQIPTNLNIYGPVTEGDTGIIGNIIFEDNN